MKNLLLSIFSLFNSLWMVAHPVITPNQFQKGSDSDRIEAAIREALKTGVNSIEIPRFNQQKQKAEWLIDRAILLPSDFTLILRDCLVRLSPGTQDNIITNSGARTRPLSANKNIRIIGIGNAVLSGGLEPHFNPPGDKGGYKTVGILLYDTQHFTIDGMRMEETQSWAISVENGCAYGRISNIDFKNTGIYPIRPNQDGVDIRKGCHDIVIENITGITGDDVVALTGLRMNDARQFMQVGGYLPTENDDIYNITIHNVQAKTTGGHALVRLLNQDGVKMYNIFISNVIETSLEGEPKVAAAIRIGDDGYSGISLNKLGDTYRIFINNVISRGTHVVLIKRSLKDSVIKGIIGFGDKNEPAVKVIGEIENVVIEAQKF